MKKIVIGAVAAMGLLSAVAVLAQTQMPVESAQPVAMMATSSVQDAAAQPDGQWTQPVAHGMRGGMMGGRQFEKGMMNQGEKEGPRALGVVAAVFAGITMLMVWAILVLIILVLWKWLKKQSK